MGHLARDKELFEKFRGAGQNPTAAPWAFGEGARNLK
jgi:hypothetical protein